MKEFLKKSALLPMLAFGISAGLVSCRPEEKQEPLEPKLEFQQTEITVSPEGGEATVLYTIVSPVQGAELMPDADCEWVHDFTVTDQAVSFQVDANEGMAREAAVTVRYTDAVSASFRVKQLETEKPFRVTVPEETLTQTTALVNVYPKDKEMGYIVHTVNKKYYESMEEADIIQELRAFCQYYANSAGMSLEEFMTANNVLDHGDLENAEFFDFYPDSEYYVLTVGMNESCETLTEMVATPFRTKAVEKIDMDFRFEYAIDGPFVTMKVEADPDDQYFYFDVVSPSDLEAYGMTLDELASQTVRQQIDFGAVFGLSPEDVVKSMCSLAVGTEKMELDVESEYIGYAVGVSLAGMVVTEAASENFTTGAVSPSDNRISLEIESVNADRVYVKATVTNDDPYGLVIAEQSDYAGMDDAAILEAILSDAMVSINKVPGDWQGRITGLEPETPYVVYAFGYLAGTATTELVSAPFTTIAPGDPREFSFTSEARDVTPNGARVVVHGMPENVLYYFDLATPDQTEEELKGMMDEIIDKNIQSNIVPDRITFFRKKGSRGTDKYDFGGLEPEGEYVVWAVSIDEETGDYVVFNFGERFRTPAKVVSDVELTVVHDKYFDADALAEAYPDRYGEYAGQNLYCLPVTLETSEPVRKPLEIIYKGNLLDEGKYPDDVLIQDLEAKGNTNQVLHWFLPYSTELTLLAVALDEEGHYTKVHRELINKAPDGASDVSEFPVPEAAFRSGVPFLPESRSFRSAKGDAPMPVVSEQLLPEIRFGASAPDAVTEAELAGHRRFDFRNPAMKERPEDRTIRSRRRF